MVLEKKVFLLERVKGAEFRLRLILEGDSIIEISDGKVSLEEADTEYAAASINADEVVLRGDREQLYCLVKPLGANCLKNSALLGL